MIETKADEIKQQVWKAADQILASGRYPTRNQLCKALSKSASTISSYFAEWREAHPKDEMIACPEDGSNRQCQNGIVLNSEDENGSNPKQEQIVQSHEQEIEPQEQLSLEQQRESELQSRITERIDKEAQLEAAKATLAKEYYKKTRLFTIPGLREEVEQTLDEISDYSTILDSTNRPKGMLEYLKRKQLR